MADESEIVKSPITDIIKNSIMEYATNKKRETPKEVKQIIESVNSRYKYVGFDNISCEYLFESQDGKEIIKYNYKTKELLSYNNEEMFHRFFNPVNKAWEIYIPQKGMHYNIKTNRWEYYNVATDEWLGTRPKAIIKDEENDENKNYTISYDKYENIFKYTSKEVSAAYLVDEKIWSIHNRITDKKAYLSAINGKEMIFDTKSGKFYRKETLKEQENEHTEHKSEVNDSKIEPDTKKSVDMEQKIKEKTDKNTDLALVSTKTTFFSKVKNWFKQKINNFKSFKNTKRDELKNQPTSVLNEEKRSETLQDNHGIYDELTSDGKLIYRSEATKQKIKEKENNKIQRRLKLAEFKKGLKFTDTKKSISLIVASGLLAIGATVNLVREGVNASQNRTTNTTVSVSENLSGNNNQKQIENNTTKKDEITDKEDNINKKIPDTRPTKNNAKNDIETTDFQNSEVNIFMVPAGTVYTSNSKETGTRGVFKEDTTVGIYNRAIVKTNEDGSKEIVLSTDGKTWEDYSKYSGITMEEIEKTKNTEGNIEMVAVNVPNTNSLEDVYGWIKSKDLKTLEFSIGDNTKILQNLTEHETEK